MYCLNCERVTKISSYEERTRLGKQLCNCNNPNLVRAVASVFTERIRIEPNQSSSSVRTSTAGREQLNFRNTSSNTPPRNPPIPTGNLRFTNSNTSSNSRNTTSSSSSFTTPSNSSRTQGSPSPSNINSNTPPRNPPPPTVNPRPTTSNTSFNSTNTTSSSSSFTTPSNSSRTQGSPSLSVWKCVVAIGVLAIAAALSPGMSAWFTAQLSQFTNNSTTQKNQQLQLTPKEVVKRYYQSATSNPEADLPLRSDAFKSYWKQKDQGNKTEEFFKQFQKVDVYSFQTLTPSSTNKAKLKVWLKYVWKNNKTTCESQIMELIFDQSQGQWLINKVSDVKYGLDCGK